jgi:hypothetical protein
MKRSTLGPPFSTVSSTPVERSTERQLPADDQEPPSVAATSAPTDLPVDLPEFPPEDRFVGERFTHHLRDVARASGEAGERGWDA